MSIKAKLDSILGRRRGYIEFTTDYTTGDKIELTRSDLRRIGEFTRENIAYWLVAIYPRQAYGWGEWTIVDFHAVCGDKDIPWASEESCNEYRRGFRDRL